MNIGFFDSSIGGIPYLEEYRTLLRSKNKSVHLSYLADNGGFPYGEKEAEYLEDRVLKISHNFISQESLDILVIACNTASLHAVESLRVKIRELYSHRKVEVIGVIPAIKPAFELLYNLGTIQRKARIYVMNTRASAQAKYAQNLINEIEEQYRANVKVFLRNCQDLVFAVEQMVLNEEESYEAFMLAELDKIIREIIELECKVVVLGCTHFLHIRSSLQKLVPSDIHIVDSLHGVTNRIEYISKQFDDTSLHIHTNSEVKFYISSNDTAPHFEYICKKYNYSFAGILE